MIVLFPIIPTVLGCFVGFFIQKFSVRFKKKKIIQTIITFIMILLFMGISFRLEELINSLIENANSFNEALSKIYYPIGAFNSLINQFSLIELLKLLLLNIIFVVAFILIASKSFFYVLSKSKEHTTVDSKEKVSIQNISFKPKNSLWSLIRKDFTKYFSSTVSNNISIIFL